MKYTAIKAAIQIGNCPMNAYLQPIESASKPPNGAPDADPVAKIMLMYPCQAPLSLRGMISDIRIETTVVIPPPPIPANILAATSSFMFRANPQNKHPMPNIRYANSKAGFLPKMSLSLPYKGWNVVTESKYLLTQESVQDVLNGDNTDPVAIQLVLLRAFNSLPILP